MGKRINVTVSDSLNERIDNYADEYGMSKSSIISFIVGQWFDKNDRFNNDIDEQMTSDSTLNIILKAISEVKSKGVKNE